MQDHSRLNGPPVDFIDFVDGADVRMVESAVLGVLAQSSTGVETHITNASLPLWRQRDCGSQSSKKQRTRTVLNGASDRTRKHVASKENNCSQDAPIAGMGQAVGLIIMLSTTVFHPVAFAESRLESKGTRACIVVPRLGSELIESSPPNSLMRSRMLVSPSPVPCIVASVLKPRPRSLTVRLTLPEVPHSCTSTCLTPAVLCSVVQSFL